MNQSYRTIVALIVGVLLLATVAAAPAFAEADTTVILVRHAEKTADKDDPALNDRGRERARELSRVLERVEVSAIFASQFRRTQQTVSPLSERTGRTVRVAKVEDPRRSSAELARRILSEFPGAVVVVAGHSNTVPLIIEALGAENPGEIPHERYDDLFVVTVGPAEVRCLPLTYGERSPAE